MSCGSQSLSWLYENQLGMHSLLGTGMTVPPVMLERVCEIDTPNCLGGTFEGTLIFSFSFCILKGIWFEFIVQITYSLICCYISKMVLIFCSEVGLL